MGGQVEVVWTCHEKRLKVCRKKSDGSGVTRKRKRGRPKRRFLDAVKIWGKLVQGRWTLKTGCFGEASYAVATPDQRERLKEEDDKDHFYEKTAQLLHSFATQIFYCRVQLYVMVHYLQTPILS